MKSTGLRNPLRVTLGVLGLYMVNKYCFFFLFGSNFQFSDKRLRFIEQSSNLIGFKDEFLTSYMHDIQVH